MCFLHFRQPLISAANIDVDGLWQASRVTLNTSAVWEGLCVVYVTVLYYNDRWMQLKRNYSAVPQWSHDSNAMGLSCYWSNDCATTAKHIRAEIHRSKNCYHARKKMKRSEIVKDILHMVYIDMSKPLHGTCNANFWKRITWPLWQCNIFKHD